MENHRVRALIYESGKQIFGAIHELTEMLDGVDYDFRPIETENGTFAVLDTYFPRMGSDKSEDVTFEFNVGDNNCVDFSWEPDGTIVRNLFTYQGQAIEGKQALRSTAWQPESIRALGVIAGFEGRPEELQKTPLQDLAAGRVGVAAWPPNIFKITPAMEDGTGVVLGGGTPAEVGTGFGVPPRFGPDPAQHDYWIGDTITVIARDLPGLDVELQGRVTDATIMSVGSAGDAVVEVTCAPTLVVSGVQLVSD